VLGAATAYWLAGGPASGLVAMQWTGRVALIALIILVIFRSIRRDAPRASPLARRVAALGFLLVGVLATSAASQLDPAPFSSYLLCWIGLTAFHCLIGLCVRLSGWWRPAEEGRTSVLGLGADQRSRQRLRRHHRRRRTQLPVLLAREILTTGRGGRRPSAAPSRGLRWGIHARHA